jgi:hypothetical protein
MYDFIKGELDLAGDPDAVAEALQITREGCPRIRARRHPDKDGLSPSDVECLSEAIAFCRARPFGTLSRLTQLERAWFDAPLNGVMDYEAMIDHDHPSRDGLLEEAREFAAYGVL